MTKVARKSGGRPKTKMSEKNEKRGQGTGVTAADAPRQERAPSSAAATAPKWTGWTYNTGILLNFANWAWIASTYAADARSYQHRPEGVPQTASVLSARSDDRLKMSREIRLL